MAKVSECIGHKKQKNSTLKWFILSLIPIVNIYVAWKMAEIISGHEKTYLSE
ncbi:hypothetical protein [[Eubacterium] cellulosolvens]